MDDKRSGGIDSPRSRLRRLQSEVDRLRHELDTAQRLLKNWRGSAARSSHEAQAALDEVQLIFDNTVVGIVFARERVIERVNRRFAELLGYAPEELVGQNTALCYADPADYERIGREGYPQLANAGVYQAEVRFRRKDGSEVEVRMSGRAVSPSDPLAATIWVFEDVTEHRAAQDRVRAAVDDLRRSEEYFRSLIENSSDLITVLDRRGVVQYQNPALEQVLGYQPAERIGRQTVELVHPDDRGLFVELLRRLDRSYPERVIAELRLRHRDGSWRTLEISAARALDPKGEIVAVVSSRDVTGRRDIEARLRSANRTLSLLRLGNERLVRARGESALAQDICRLVASEGGYQLAWIGYVQDDARGTVKPVAWYGPASGYMEGLLVTSDDSDHGRGPGGSAVRSGRTVYEPDVEASLAMKPWAAQALQHGVRSLLALPLASGGRTFGLMSIYAGAAAAFDVDEISLLEELAGDVAYGITTLRTQRRLGKSLEDAVQAIATAAELRDAYTAGHQRRVSELASAIARRLGLDEHRIRGLHLAGVVHDVGKINIPAEILAKPSRLTAAEYELIKGHPGAGYEILRGIEFPWPVAEIVRQHHELCDGSGYPQGLKGEQILQEARILTVADVVEAMASHRPYRPGLGIDAALAEIARHRGVRYDAQAVDACIALFREHGYRL